MNDLVQLLTEARDHLHEIRKAITNSVGDYGLDVEIAIHFIDRALQTEGWTDVSKALDKAYQALNRDYGEEDENYDGLVERLRGALGLDPESD
jgi:hypothetical protein